MTTFALPNFDGGGVGAENSLPGGKIIQRISRPRLSDSANQCLTHARYSSGGASAAHTRHVSSGRSNS